jgi:Flp pilus assembly protein TadD
MKRLLRAIVFALLAAAPLAARAEVSPELTNGIAAARADYERARKALDKLDWSAAISALESAARHDPQDAEFQNLLGFAHRNKGDMDAAFRHYFRALELNPSHKGAHEYIGRAYLMVDQPGKAREHLRLLEKACWEVCRERDLLKRAIEEYPWPSEPRLSSRGY